MNKDKFKQQRARALALVKRLHAGQFRTKGAMPTWHHVDRVSWMLERYLNHYKECTPSERQAIILAGLGHDAIEDSDVRRERLQAVFGARGLELIEGMTNRQGDDHQAVYVRQVCTAEEGVRLIKLADLVDNCSSVTLTLGIMGNKWLDSYFLPIIRPMVRAISKTKFRIYRQTGARLMEMALEAYDQLLVERQRFIVDQRQARARRPLSG